MKWMFWGIGFPIILVGCAVIWYFFLPVILGSATTFRSELKRKGMKIGEWSFTNENTYDLLKMEIIHDGITTMVNTAIPRDGPLTVHCVWDLYEALKLTLDTAIPEIDSDRSMTEYSIELGLK